jgi:hypothetical protein
MTRLARDLHNQAVGESYIRYVSESVERGGHYFRILQREMFVTK